MLSINKNEIQRIKKKFYPMFDFNQGQNVTISTPEKILDCIVHASVTHDFVENSTQTLRLMKNDIPAPRTIRYHLGKLGIENILSQFNMISDELYQTANKQRWFINKVDLAIDTHDWMYYGNKNDDMVLGTQPKMVHHLLTSLQLSIWFKKE